MFQYFLQPQANHFSLVIEKFQEHKYEKQQSVIPIACVHTALPIFQYPNCAVIVKKQQEDKYEEKECAVVVAIYTI